MPHALAGRSVVLVGLMGAGKTSIGRRVAARLGLPFRDADTEIELAAGCTIPELFERHGEAHFRQGERKVIRRLLAGDPVVLATGGGAFADPLTRASVRADAVSVWLRVTLPVLVRRVSLRSNRPMLKTGDPARTMADLLDRRSPFYAEADLTVDCSDESPDQTTAKVLAALAGWAPLRRLAVHGARPYEVVVGPNLLARAGAILAPVLPQRRAVVVTDETVAARHLPALLDGLAQTGVHARTVVVPPGEASKSLAVFGQVVDELLADGLERRTTVVALGGGVVGDLAGFAAATVMRGLPFVQVPTTLLSQVDSSVGGKTGINTRAGKNLLGAFHPPVAVLADTETLLTLPPRELRAGYAEIAKAGLIGDPSLWNWCEAHGAAITGDDPDPALLADAVMRACAFKAAVVAEDEREEAPSNGRALLNLGHTFGHALEAEVGYTGELLHGEAVATGLGLASRLSARLGLLPDPVADRIAAHLEAVGLPSAPSMLNRRFSAARLLEHMRRDKKVRDGQMHLVLLRAIGEAFTTAEVAQEDVEAVLREHGCAP